MINFKI